ncbi:MAG: DNA recombination protein RmuC [Candidatus Omnitrophota bacterium]
MIILAAVIILISAITLLILLLRNPDANLIRFESAIRDEVAKNRDEMGRSLKDFSDTGMKQFLGLTQVTEQKLDYMRNTVEERLRSLQEDNAEKLEKMRETVDEKLHTTLEKRLGDSFKLVSERLESVQRGLGDMQSLAAGVGDLKKVLTNVKTRGTLGEIQLETLLAEILTPDQYAKNVATKTDSRENVEFAIKLPGKGSETVWLPVDAKFPKEDYERLVDAQEQSNPELIEEFSKALEQRVKSEAKDIRDKYIDPPHTTDFGVLFLATEGLYAEVVRRPGLFQMLQREYRVIVTGPTTIAAFLNSLQMGFRTLAIEKRASEVWNLLGAIKTEFSKFGDLLEKTRKQLTQAANTIDGASRKTRTIERKLRDVQELPSTETVKMLEDAEDDPAPDTAA